MRRFLVLAVVSALLIAPGCTKKAEKVEISVPDDELAAEVEDWQLTNEEFEAFLRRLPQAQRARYETPEGRVEFAQRIMQEEMAYLEAKKMKLEEREDIAAQIESATRSILVSQYLMDVVDVKARPSDEELHEYYDMHQDLYTSLETIRAQHIFALKKAKLDDLKQQIDAGTEKFTTLAQKFSEDPLTKRDGGDLGFFNPGGYIKGVGFSQTFSDAVSAMEPGKVYGPIKWDQGYSLVRVNEKRPAELRPYEDVREDIASRLSADKVENVRTQHFDEVQKNYKTRNLMAERYGKSQRGPQELFDLAQNSSDPRQRLQAFQEIVDKYPQDAVAPQALFMVGFVYAEEIKDYAMADRTFSSVIEKYPESEMAQTAKWMMDNLDKPLPKFDNLDDLNRQIEGKTR